MEMNQKQTGDKKYIGKDTPMAIALKDISEYHRTNNIKIWEGNHEVWVVSANYLISKEVRKLNRDLGLHCINKAWKEK